MSELAERIDIYLLPESLPIVPTLDLLTTCYHEISHGICHIHYGWPFDSIEISDDPASAYKGFLKPIGGIRKHREWATACLAGPVGEARYTGTDWYELTDTRRSDFKMAKESLAQLSDPPSLHVVASEAAAILSVRWRSVGRCAFLLAERRRLTHAECLHAISRW